VGQPGFFDLDKRLEAISAKDDPVEALKTLIPFEGFRAEIEAVVRLAPEDRKSNAGRFPLAKDTGELRSQQCTDEQSGLPAEDVALGDH
jgi:hypothetical protein